MMSTFLSNKKIATLFFATLLSVMSMAQTGTVTGKVTDKDGVGIPNVSITANGKTIGITNQQGGFSVKADKNTAITFTSIGYTSTTMSIGDKSALDITMEGKANSDAGEVTVIGYASVRKKDVTGAIATIKEKDFNRGVVTSPDQLFQGKVSGVQMVTSSGAPNAPISVRIRGNSSIRAGSDPLFVVDGVQLPGGTARPGSTVDGDLGGLPGGNPLSFLNPADIASIDVLKDASATAIYGSRGANGVVIITTKKGKSGRPKLEFNTSYATSKISRSIDYATADEYRAGLTKYGLTTGNLGGNTDAMKAITQTGGAQNYSVAMSGGSDGANYRLSLGYLKQKGIILKSGFEKYNADFTSSFKFLESKKLVMDIHIIANQNQEQIAPISNNGGFRGSLIGAALQWNPTRNLFKPNGALDIDQGGDNINPLGMSRAYDDKLNVTNILASVSPSYKFTNDLEYKLLVSFNKSVGSRRQQIRNFINMDGYQNDPAIPISGGWGRLSNEDLTTQQITHTLNYNKRISSLVNIGALVGYEYQKIEKKGGEQSAKDFGALTINYYDGLAFSSQGTRRTSTFFDPTEELQSYFTRANVDIGGKYLLTATFRADGSNKFGSNNRYGYFPSFSAAWNVSKEKFAESFLKNSTLKIRAGWGRTGNQAFPAGSSLTRFVATGPGAYSQVTADNPNLQWQEDNQSNIGFDLGMLNSRINVTVDYFNKKTKKILANITDPIPTPGTRRWLNLPGGEIKNSGVEASVNALVVSKKDFQWNIGVNATFQKNEVNGLSGPLLTGAINGQGLSGAFVQRMTNGQPLNAFYVRQFNGIDKTTGQANLTDDGAFFYFAGSGNPTTLLGINTSVDYKKFSLSMAFNGAYGHKIYNNTLNAVLPINNLGNRNVSASLLTGDKESTSSPITTSDRYLEKGNFLRLANATLNYNVGNLGKAFKNCNVFVTGQNLLLFTKFKGFDPEVNVDKNIDGVPSFGIEYTPFPAARTFIFGLNFAL